MIVAVAVAVADILILIILCCLCYLCCYCWYSIADILYCWYFIADTAYLLLLSWLLELIKLLLLLCDRTASVVLTCDADSYTPIITCLLPCLLACLLACLPITYSCVRIRFSAFSSVNSCLLHLVSPLSTRCGECSRLRYSFLFDSLWVMQVELVCYSHCTILWWYLCLF